MKTEKIQKIDITKVRQTLINNQPTESKRTIAQAMVGALSDAQLIAREKSRQLFSAHEEKLRRLYPGMYAAFVDGKLIVGKTQEDFWSAKWKTFPGSKPLSANFDPEIFDRTTCYGLKIRKSNKA